jgi:hypothetical protein
LNQQAANSVGRNLIRSPVEAWIKRPETSANARPAHLLSLSFFIFGGRVFEFGDQLLELRGGAEVFQIVGGNQGIAIFLPAFDGFP